MSRPADDTDGSGRRPGQFGRFRTPDDAWLDGADPEPAFPYPFDIVDAHHHFWDRQDHRYMPADMAADVGRLPVRETIYVECRNHYRASGPAHLAPVGETEWVLDATAKAGISHGPVFAAGITGFADMTLGNRAGEVLDAHLEAAGSRFVGIRYSGAWDDDATIGNSHICKAAGLYRDSLFQEGLRELVKRDLVFDAFVFFHQIDDVIAIARQHPDLRIVLGHMGCPLGYGRHQDRAAVFSAWNEKITRLAASANVSVKIGGLVSRLAAFDYFSLAKPPNSTEFADHWAAYVDRTIALFGPERCMFESNFPVCRMGIGYTAMWNGFAKATHGLSVTEAAALFSGTARRIYRLARQPLHANTEISP